MGSSNSNETMQKNQIFVVIIENNYVVIQCLVIKVDMYQEQDSLKIVIWC